MQHQSSKPGSCQQIQWLRGLSGPAPVRRLRLTAIIHHTLLNIRRQTPWCRNAHTVCNVCCSS